MLDRRRTVFAALPLLLAGAPAASLTLPFLGGSHRVEVEVRELPAEDRWQVSYHLPARAAGVDLVHGRGSHRRPGWSVPEGAQWVDAPGVERLCFAHRSRDFTISFATDTGARSKDYEVNVAMSDGGRLLYTGHLVVRPLAHCGAGTAAEAQTDELPHRFRFTTDDGRNIRVGDLAATGSLTWNPPAGEEETYAYFGPQAAAEGERMALLADPALPAWLRRDLEPTVAAIFDRFAGETAISLPNRPLVLLAFDPHGSGRSFGGGVLGGVVQLTASGDGWLAESAEARADWLVRLAHELFHLWDGAALHPDAESEWLSEAAAEAFALRAAYGLGALGEGQVAQRLVDLGNRCLAGLEGQSLLSAPQRRAWDTWYTCGPVLLFVAGEAVERAHPGQGGLGLLVREMFAEGQRAGGVYGTGTFLGWLDKLAGDRPTVYALQGLIRRGQPHGADRLLQRLLDGAGYHVTLASPAQARADPEVYRSLLARGVIRCACGPGDAPTTPSGDCARFAGGQRITRLDDIDVRHDPAAAYGRLRAAAELGRPLRVLAGDDPQPLTLLCGRDTLDPSFDQLLRLR